MVSLSEKLWIANARWLVNVSVYSRMSPGFALTLVPGPRDSVMFATCFARSATVKFVVTDAELTVSPPYSSGSNGTLPFAVLTADPVLALGVPTTVSVAVDPDVRFVTVATTVCAPFTDEMEHDPPPVTAHEGRVVDEITTFAGTGSVIAAVGYVK